MREVLESFGAIVVRTGGLALLVLYPLIPFLLLYAGLMAVGRGTWSKGTEEKQWAKKVLFYETDPITRAVAQDILDHYES